MDKVKAFKISFWVILIVGFIIWAYWHDCVSEADFFKKGEKYGVFCSKGHRYVKIHIRNSDNYIVYFKHGVRDTTIGMSGCGNYIKFHGEDTEVEFFVLYTDHTDYVMPIETMTQYRFLKRYYPDSAKLIDTSDLY